MSIDLKASTLTKNKISWLTLAFLLAFLTFIHIRLYHYAEDDAYIHFRVAEHLFLHGVPYYNLDEIVKVSTSSGWTIFLTLLLGVAHFLGAEHDFPLLVAIANAFFTLCGTAVYTQILATLLPEQATPTAKLLFQTSFLAFTIPSSIGLMETPLALMTAGVGLYLLLLHKPAGFAALSFAAYSRLELLLPLALALFLVIIQKQYRFRSLVAYLAIGLTPLLIYDLYFFQTVIPHSIIAKANVYSIPQSQTIFQILLSMTPKISTNSDWISLVVCSIFLSMIPLTLFTALIEWRKDGNYWPLLYCSWGILVIAGYLIGHALVFNWYMPLYTIPILMAYFLNSSPPNYPRQKVIKSQIVVLFFISATAIVGTFYAALYDPSAFTLFIAGSRVKTYLYVGSILNEQYPNATLLTSEIGGLGYSFKGKVSDAAGLASPDALDFHPMTIPEERAEGSIGAIPPAYVVKESPDLIVTYDLFAQALMRDVAIQQYNLILFPAYRPQDAVYAKDEELWGSEYLRVYIHKDLSISQKLYNIARLIGN